MDFISLGIAILSLIIAGISFFRTKKFEDFEYSAMLQLSSEKAQFGSQRIEKSNALEYKASLENQGLKTVKIISIELQSGSIKEESKRYTYPLLGEYYITSGQKIDFEKTITWNDVSRVKEAHQIDECVFNLKICYEDINGDRIEKYRGLGGFGVGENSFVVIIEKKDTIS